MSDSSLSSRQSAAQCVGPVHTTPDSLTTARDCSSSGQPADFGTTPADWQVVNAGEIGDFRGGNGFPIKYQGSEEGDYPFFKVSDLSGQKNSSVMVSAKYYITEEERASLGANLFPADAIVFAKIGAAIFLERKKLLAKNSCIDNNLAAFVLTDPSVDPRFIYFAFHNVRLGERVSTTALPSLGRRVLASIRLPLPNSDEQRAIATALSDADALIESLDRLIAKKRAIKQAAMQQLVTGETRLPGFDGDWQRVRLGELGRWRGGATPSMSVAEYWENGNTPWVSSSDIRQGEIESMSGRITDRAVRETAVTVVPKILSL